MTDYSFRMNSANALALILASLPLLGCIPHASADGTPAPDAKRTAVSRVERNLASHFGDIEGSFVLLDPRKSTIVWNNPQRAQTRFLPASTFKIPNTLIALETGTANGPDFLLEWDSDVAPRQPWWPASWARDHTLRTALANSAVWYYQELARRIGPERMASHLEQFSYGNQDISGGIDRFWLSGGLRISPEEQVDFLRRFYFGELGVSERATELLKEILVIEETPKYRLSGKTGWVSLGDDSGPDIGWLVGYLERDDEVFFFATNIEIRTNADAAERLRITRSILAEMGLLGD